MSHQLIRVELSERSYSIHIGQNLIGRLPEFLAPVLGKCRHVILVSDSAVASTFGSIVAETMSGAGYRVSSCIVPSGESSKSPTEAVRLWQTLVDERTDRGSAVIALGGGVVGDLAGFIAATFARGLPLVQVPTTLLSQVDSSVGGKTGINLPTAKNIVGCFWQPQSVVIDIESLKTLPRREFLSGLAEVVKYGVILLPDLFDYLESNTQAIKALDGDALTRIIAESCRAKAMVVSQDERETTGLRAILNYGHTFAHAVESEYGYGTYLHGEAVSIGMHMAARLAHVMGRVPAEFVDRQERLLKAFELPVALPNTDRSERLWELMQHDKKVQHGKLRFILPTRMGHVELVPDVTREVVLQVLQQVI